LINGDDYSGAERVQDLLALRLRDSGYEVGIACTKPGRFRTARQAQDVPLIELPMRSRFDVRPVFRLAKYIRQHGYDLLHSHSARTALIGRPAAALAGVPLIHHMHCQTSTEVTKRWLSRINAIIERCTLFRVPGVIAVSPTIAEDLRRRGISDSQIALIPNGVPSPGPLADREPPSTDWVVGTVAMFRPRKGIETLLMAIANLRRQQIPIRLRAVGCFQTAEYEAATHELVQELGLADAVDWTGFTRDVNAELSQMDLFVLPSLVPEGLPMAVLEAMAAGVPALGSRVDGVIDVIEHGVNGLLFEPGDADDLTRQLNSFIQGDTDWSEIRRRGYQFHADGYSDVAMSAAVAELYNNVLSRTRGTAK
jgi:glycosyltransferase involved in cell wall biosynthesis